jgi:hypothetical protein
MNECAIGIARPMMALQFNDDHHQSHGCSTTKFPRPDNHGCQAEEAPKSSIASCK